MKLSTALGALAAALALALPPTAEARQRILLYTKTATFRHDSIPTAIAQITEWSNTTWPGFDVVATENQSLFDRAGWLDQFDALVFVSTSGRILSRQGQRNMITYLQKGGGFMGVHEASDSVYQPWYGRLVGAFFDYHPEECRAEMLVQPEVSSHPSVSWIKNGSWIVRDEMYNYLSDPRIYGRRVTLAANESSYHDPVTSKADRAAAQGSPHPISWFTDNGNNLLNPASYHVGGNTDDTATSLDAGGGDGRMFYTALGHSNETWTSSPGFKRHFLGGLVWILNSTTIRSYSSETDAWRVGQQWEERPPYVAEPDIDEKQQADTQSAANATTNSKQRHSANAAVALAPHAPLAFVAGAASLVSAIAMWTAV
ncbi:uncharacterized protein PFL1_04564 [Pseudozyma flocculosa PF-1]|uniref:ThuA-like domain-containing protein n=2 Tax=Pseudozyma flocculosa TaxID=84751 RepID=A0A5C3F9C5_9BASI|nr:uncharacterized protein PFL1_04564 [Pseudozyma flocculosa PF-1]EPQ27819.1 hypothetical protein PFL1_04564 [Pseudozyma flocculosa PF-1]SPO41053.1 uncharacterized protein PSFLO_06535 [Pseudozyma flocculosa]